MRVTYVDIVSGRRKREEWNATEVQRTTEVTTSRELKMRDCNERVASLVQGKDDEEVENREKGEKSQEALWYSCKYVITIT